MINSSVTDIPRAFTWKGDHLLLLDQTRLPLHQEWLRLENLEEVCEAIKMLRVRGAPAIGVAAAYGAALEIRRIYGAEPANAALNADRWLHRFRQITATLRSTRPTAVNLFHCMDRMDRIAGEIALDWKDQFEPIRAAERMEEEAIAIHSEDENLCSAIGGFGSTLIPDGASVLTHCNTGSLATGGIGTALGAIYTAHLQGKRLSVFADETRPLLQGGRITAWELFEAGIPVRLITDSMAASVMARGEVDLILVGADRIASNGDTANKIGTMPLAVLARHFGVPFYVVAPTTTLDPSMDSGATIEIEERDPDEVRKFQGNFSAPPEVEVFNPAFDVTPGDLISGIVTEKGIHRPPYDFRALMAQGQPK
ncbi:MAG: S-methyl-5-thioribose-1-phosphate isomerase [Leptospiraceae bacterium]|nr:S-methyl-5-thioribose-1-phosphate isomerase [Leptospiraceae bacterium]MCB1171422.1 S-methyl-5-thioribose-1-phosphate isomerase [Leptospiraceae bacterium]